MLSIPTSKNKSNNNNNKKARRLYRQGDVLLKRIDGELPKNLIPVNTDILAEGEATGHHHRLSGSAQILVNPQKTTEKYLAVEQETQLIHQEHNQLTNQRTGELEPIQPGTYIVNNEREYDYTEEAFRQVRD